MGDLGDRFRRAVQGDEPAAEGLERVLGRARRRNRARRVTSAVVGLAMFGGASTALWLAAVSGQNRIGQDETLTTPSTTTALADDDLSPVARITCEEGRTVAVDRTVDALADGVHFSVTNRTDKPVVFSGGGQLAPGATDEFVLQSEPGSTEIACYPADRADATDPERTLVQVNDPRSYWVSGDIDCVTTEVNDLAAGGPGFAGTPEEVVRERWELRLHIQPMDIVRRAGYPLTPAPVVVIRDGVTVASVYVSPADDGGWHISGWGTCDAFSDSEPPGPPGNGSPSAARVICESDGVVVQDERVTAQADGVHVVVENTASLAMWFSDIRKLHPGEVRELILSFGPGAQEIFCRPDGEFGEEGKRTASVNVTDPNGYWRSPEHDCAGGGVAITDLDSTPIEGEPAEIARDYLETYKESPDDQVVYGEYPDQRSPEFLVIHDGRVIVRFELTPHGDGLWAPSGLSYCV